MEWIVKFVLCKKFHLVSVQSVNYHVKLDSMAVGKNMPSHQIGQDGVWINGLSYPIGQPKALTKLGNADLDAYTSTSKFVLFLFSFVVVLNFFR